MAAEWPALSKHNGKHRLDDGCIDPPAAVASASCVVVTQSEEKKVDESCGDAPSGEKKIEDSCGGVIVKPAPAAKVDDDGPHEGILNAGGGGRGTTPPILHHHHHHHHKRPPKLHGHNPNHIHTSQAQAYLPPQYYYHPSIPTPPTTNYNFYFQAPTNFINGPNLPDSAYYFQPTPSGWVRVPHPQPSLYLPPPPPLPYPPPPVSVPPPPSPIIALKASIVKQIEYYFCDENLQDDYYLKSLMDDQGWVPLTQISKFRMIKRLNVDIPLIVDALQASHTIQVEGQMIRRRNDWQKWLPTSVSRILS